MPRHPRQWNSRPPIRVQDGQGFQIKTKAPHISEVLFKIQILSTNNVLITNIIRKLIKKPRNKTYIQKSKHKKTPLKGSF